MTDEFISISNVDLHGVTGGKKPATTTPTPPTAPPDETGKYCKDGMKTHTGIGGNGSLETPLGVKVTGDIRYDHTECK